MPPPTPPTTFLGQRFADYGVGWPAADHADAMACRDLEERLAYGLHLFQLAQDRHAADRDRVAASGAAFDLAAARYVEQLLSLWMAPATDALARVAEMEAKGFTVDRAAEFRRAVTHVRHSLSVTPEQAAAIFERVARAGFTGTRTTEDIRRERQP